MMIENEMTETKGAAMKIVVDTDNYYSSHLRKPSGTGMWCFQVGDQMVSWTGSYAACLKLAKAFAAEVRKVGVVVVLP